MSLLPAYPIYIPLMVRTHTHAQSKRVREREINILLLKPQCTITWAQIPNQINNRNQVSLG